MRTAVSLPIDTSPRKIIHRTESEKSPAVHQKSPWSSEILEFRCVHKLSRSFYALPRDSDLEGHRQGPAMFSTPSPSELHVVDLHTTFGETLSSSTLDFEQLLLAKATLTQPSQLSSRPAHISCYFQEVSMRKKPGQTTCWIPVMLVPLYFPALPVLLAHKRKK